MVRSLSSPRLEVKLSASLLNTLADAASVSVGHPNLNHRTTLTNGIGNNQANRGWQRINRSLVSGGSEVLDLYDMVGVNIGAGAGLDGLGQAVDFEDVVAIVIVNNNAVTAAGQLEIDPDAFKGWTPIGTHTVATGGALRGQGIMVKANPAESGFDVDDGTSHRLRFTANGGAVTYSVYLLCRSDDEYSSSSSSLSVSSSSWSSASASSSTSKSSSSSSQSMSVSSSVSSSSASSSSSPSSSPSSSSVSSSSSLSSSSESSSSQSSSYSSLVSSQSELSSSSSASSSSQSASSSSSSVSSSSPSSSSSSSVSSSSVSSSSWSS